MEKRKSSTLNEFFFAHGTWFRLSQHANLATGLAKEPENVDSEQGRNCVGSECCSSKTKLYLPERKRFSSERFKASQRSCPRPCPRQWRTNLARFSEKGQQTSSKCKNRFMSTSPDFFLALILIFDFASRTVLLLFLASFHRFHWHRRFCDLFSSKAFDISLRFLAYHRRGGLTTRHLAIR
jgi:hypothetical protein